MNASRQLQCHWRCESDQNIERAVQKAQASVRDFAQATAAHGSLIQNWVGGREVLQYEHYPANDVVDARSGSQFYYHAHRDGDHEHGHLHLFWHASASGKRRYFPRGKPRWGRTAPTHLFAISLDARGLPVGLFTVNQWVTDGHWLDAARTLACVDRFVLGNLAGYEHGCQWLNGFVRFYRPLVEHLLMQRDRRLARRADRAKALQDHTLEVLSQTPIDWAADLDALQAEWLRRSA